MASNTTIGMQVHKAVQASHNTLKFIAAHIVKLSEKLSGTLQVVEVS